MPVYQTNLVVRAFTQGVLITVSMASIPAHVHIQINGLRWPSASVLIACLALAFTIGTFWWLNARQGRLKSFEPHTFAAGIQEPGLVVLLRFPLVLYNTGAKPIVIQDMRLSFLGEPHSAPPMPWLATRSHIKPVSDDGHAFPAVFSVPGRTAHQMFIEFKGSFPGVIPEVRDYQAVIEVKLGHRREWKHLLRFTVRAAHITIPDRFITYSNAPHNLTPELIMEAEAARKEFCRKIEGGEGGQEMAR
jgi:hypothetical protein